MKALAGLASAAALWGCAGVSGGAPGSAAVDAAMDGDTEGPGALDAGPGAGGIAAEAAVHDATKEADPLRSAATPDGSLAADTAADVAVEIASAPADADAVATAEVADAANALDASGPKGALAQPVTQPMWLTSGAFAKNAAYPSAIAFAPAGWQPAGPLHVVVYLHGHYNCATNVLGDADTTCKAGGSKRPASKLASQFTATGKKALLLVPEVKVDEGNSDPGAFGKAGGFKAFLAEALAALKPPLLPRKVDDVATLAVVSHSGGYLAAAGIATQGGVQVDELWLLDSLYGAYPSFVAWAKQGLAGFGGTGPDWQRRLFVVYTDGGGTAGLSKQLAAEAKAWVPAGAWLHDQTTATWAEVDYDHGLLFKHSGLSHHAVTTYYVGKLVASGLAPY
ncbi:MAG: hypothetical protein FJ100_14520 [Deltaproteobacteria bacterium]|nr:hypothetical protein [Deltaproteobacteria bacterium]